MIMAGQIYYGQKKILKPSENIENVSELCLHGATDSFASRGGHKLEKAIVAFNTDVGSGPSLLFVTMPSLFAQLPAGGFFVFGLLIAVANKLKTEKGVKPAESGCENCPMAKSCSIRGTADGCDGKEAEA